MTEINQYLGFIKEIKSVTGTDWPQFDRQESTAEHTWRMALLVALIAKKFPELDYEKLLFMSLIHDIGERYTEDQSVA